MIFTEYQLAGFYMMTKFHFNEAYLLDSNLSKVKFQSSYL